MQLKWCVLLNCCLVEFEWGWNWMNRRHAITERPDEPLFLSVNVSDRPRVRQHQTAQRERREFWVSLKICYYTSRRLQSNIKFSRYTRTHTRFTQMSTDDDDEMFRVMLIILSERKSTRARDEIKKWNGAALLVKYFVVKIFNFPPRLTTLFCNIKIKKIKFSQPE